MPTSRPSTATGSRLIRCSTIRRAAFETEDVDQFEPFSSKFDYYVDGKAQLTERELHGLALFNNPGKGNCTSCHPSVHQEFSSRALFTDFSYDNIGIPRNWAIPANAPNPVSPVSGRLLSYMPAAVNVPVDAEYAFYDLGLCGPFLSSAQDGGMRSRVSGWRFAKFHNRRRASR